MRGGSRMPGGMGPKERGPSLLGTNCHVKCLSKERTLSWTRGYTYPEHLEIMKASAGPGTS